MDWSTLDLELLLTQIWTALESGNGRPEAPFWAGILGTTGSDGCLMRVMVVRRVSRTDRELICCSDVRTEKIQQIKSNPQVQWLFFDPLTKVQIRAEGNAVVHQGDELTTALWNESPAVHRARYRSAAAPGCVIDSPENLRFEPGKSDGEGIDHFAVIRSTVRAFDWLWVGPAGNRRARFEWDGTKFRGAWLVA